MPHDGHHGEDHDPTHGHAHEKTHAEGHGHSHAHDAVGSNVHGHGHDHAHGHGHTHGPVVERDDLPKNAGVGKILFLDAPSGLAGDMIIAALVDLGVPATVIAEAAAALPITGYHLHFGTKVRSGVVAAYFDVHLDSAQPERTFREIREMLATATLDPAVRIAALVTFERLARAEAKVHRSSIDDVHFHEVGAIDAIVDVVGSAAALVYLGAELVVSPLPLGRGFVNARHGRLPLPAPATVECLAGLPTYDGGLEFEFVTPTGAAIVGAHAKHAARWPSMRPERTGWGSGTADLKDRPNLLRAILGERTAASHAHGEGSQTTHTVLEANLDDATGELVAHCIEMLLAAGALDAWATPATMKKGRPAFVLSALATATDADRLAVLLLSESTSLGVRRRDVGRMERPREIVSIATKYGELPVKIAGGAFGPPQIKPEFDACVAAAREHRVPVREVLREVMVAAAQHLGHPADPHDHPREHQQDHDHG